MKLHNLILAFLLVTPAAFAEKMNIETHGVVIRKLEVAIKALPRETSTKQRVRVRLADIYADRGRLNAMKEIKANCDGCKGSKRDRARGIELYEEAFSSKISYRRDKVLLQLAHLYGITDQSQKRKELFEGVIRRPKAHATKVRSLAFRGLGEHFFAKSDFKKALDNYKKALQFKNVPKKAEVLHRLSWTYLNLGKHQKALDQLVDLIKDRRNLVDGKGVYSFALHDEVARDLAIFIARGKTTDSEIDLLLKLSPKGTRKANLQYLGEETERVGKKHATLSIWKRMMKVSRGREKLDPQLRIAKTRHGLGQKKESLNELKYLVRLWKQYKCGNKEDCQLLTQTFRDFVIKWNRLDKNTVNKNLLTAYSHYLDLFQYDLEMNYWAAGIAQKLKSYRTAIKYFHKASLISQNQKNALEKKLFVGSLLGEIESAELQGAPTLRESAYRHYLKMNPKGAKANLVRYQIAQVHYELKKYKQAAKQFHILASDTKSRFNLKKKSADLALDSLTFSKDDETIEKWATSYKKLFPKFRAEYNAIARKSILNQAAKIINSKRKAKRINEYALAKLNKVDLSGSSKQERVSYYRNRIVIAENLNQLSTMIKAADNLLLISGIDADTVEFANQKKMIAHELRFEFRQAYKTVQKLRLPKLSAANKMLKTAILGELAGENSFGQYEEYLQLNNSKSAQANLIRAKLIRADKDPQKRFFSYANALSASPDLMSELAIEIFAKSNDIAMAERALTFRALKKTLAKELLSRQVFLHKHDQLMKLIRKTKVSAKNDATLQRTLKERISLIQTLEKNFKNSSRAGDWLAQIVTLTAVADENARLETVIKGLPTPRGLNAAERQQYKTLLLQQSAPYGQKSLQAKAELKKLWKLKKSSVNLAKDYKASVGATRKLYGKELTRLKQVAPKLESKYFAKTLRSSENRPSTRRLQSTRKRLKSNPFDIGVAKRLMHMEEKAGFYTRVAFLEAHIRHIMKRGKR